jgi:hypothetical protein
MIKRYGQGQAAVVVPGCAHSESCMLLSRAGLSAILPRIAIPDLRRWKLKPKAIFDSDGNRFRCGPVNLFSRCAGSPRNGVSRQTLVVGRRYETNGTRGSRKRSIRIRGESRSTSASALSASAKGGVERIYRTGCVQ